MASSDGDGENSSGELVEDDHFRLAASLLSPDEDDEDLLGHVVSSVGGRFVLACPHGPRLTNLGNLRDYTMSPEGRAVGRRRARHARHRRLSSVARAPGFSFGGVLRDQSRSRSRSRSPLLARVAFQRCGTLAVLGAASGASAVPAVPASTLPHWLRRTAPLLLTAAHSPPPGTLAAASTVGILEDADEATSLPSEEDEDDEDEDSLYRYRFATSDPEMSTEEQQEGGDDVEASSTVAQDDDIEEDEEEEDEGEDDEEEDEEEEEDADETEAAEDEEDEDEDEEEEEEMSPAATLSAEPRISSSSMEAADEDDEDEHDEEPSTELTAAPMLVEPSAPLAPPPDPQQQEQALSQQPHQVAEPAAPALSSASTLSEAGVSPAGGPPGLVGSLLEILECPVCYEAMRPPIWQCSRGHLVCKDCAPRLRRCPTCRCTARRSRNCTMEKVCEKLRYPCRYGPRGCSAALPPAELEAHEQTACPHRDAPCRVPRCQWRGLDAQLRSHALVAHCELVKFATLGAAVSVRVPLRRAPPPWPRHSRLLDTHRGVFFVHFLVSASSSQLAGCVQLFGPPLEARRFEYRMELDERSGQQRRSERAERREHREHREATQHIADIQEHINLFQARLRHGHGAASSETAGLAAGGALEDSTWAWARVLGVDEDPEHVLRGARAWRGNLASSRRPASRARVRVTLCERRDGRESTATATRG